MTGENIGISGIFSEYPVNTLKNNKIRVASFKKENDGISSFHIFVCTCVYDV